MADMRVTERYTNIVQTAVTNAGQWNGALPTVTPAWVNGELVFTIATASAVAGRFDLQQDRAIEITRMTLVDGAPANITDYTVNLIDQAGVTHQIFTTTTGAAPAVVVTGFPLVLGRGEMIQLILGYDPGAAFTAKILARHLPA